MVHSAKTHGQGFGDACFSGAGAGHNFYHSWVWRIGNRCGGRSGKQEKHSGNSYKNLLFLFENLLLGGGHPKKNRFLYVDYQSGDRPKYQNGTLNCILEELPLLRAVRSKPEPN